MMPALASLLPRNWLSRQKLHLWQVASRRATSCSLSRKIDGLVAVFDNVLSRDTLAVLTAPPVYDTGPDVYRRQDGPISPQDMIIESVVQSLLLANTREVEWWGWSEWQAVDAHRDVDEEAAALRAERRYPTHTAVLYLNVEPELRAPTCIWVPHRESAQRSVFVTVPAVAGRLVLFSGPLLHAVPRPTLQWLTPAKPGDDAIDSIHERSVMVLNLWNDKAPADEPGYVDDDDSEIEDTGVSVNVETDSDSELPQKIAPQVACEPRQLWKTVPVIEAKNELGGSILQPGCRQTTLHTYAHGSDAPLLTRIMSSVPTVAVILQSASTPHWVLAETNVRDLELGVPSLTGTRLERGRNT